MPMPDAMSEAKREDRHTSPILLDDAMGDSGETLGVEEMAGHTTHERQAQHMFCV